MLRAALVLILVAVGAPADTRVLAARGQWVAIDRTTQCEAATRAQRIATKNRTQALAGFAFDRRGSRQGQFFARLSRIPRDGSSVMLKVGDLPFMLVARGDWAWSSGPRQEAAILAAARQAGAMRIDGRDRSGRRFTDRYALDGAPTAIDAAAACSAMLVKPRARP